MPVRNGVYSSTYLTVLSPQGGYLLVAPAQGRIGYKGEQRIDQNCYPYLREAARRFKAKTGKALTVTEAWRSQETQQLYFLERYVKSPGNRPTGVNWNGFYWIKRSGESAAAVPGTSNHGVGRAFDFASGINTSFNSFENNAFGEVAGPLGFRNTGEGFDEPWHWEWRPEWVILGDFADDGITPIETTPTINYGDDDMPFLIGIKGLPADHPRFGEVSIVAVPGIGAHKFGTVGAYEIARNVHNDNESRLAGPGDGYPWPVDLTKVARYEPVAYDNIVQMYTQR